MIYNFGFLRFRFAFLSSGWDLNSYKIVRDNGITVQRY